MSTLTRLTLTETRLFLREPLNVFFALGFPPVLVVVLGSVPSFRQPQADLDGLRTIDLYVPILVALGITLFALTGLPQQFATYREKGFLRRLRTTPVRPTAMLGAQLAMCTMLSAVTTVAILALARLVFSVDLPGNQLAYLAAFVLSAVALLAIGLLVASLAATGKGAGAAGTVLLFPILFFGGLWLPRESMPEVLRTISDLTPLGASVQSLQDAGAGHWPELLPVAVLLGWTVLASGLATRYFRWE